MHQPRKWWIGLPILAILVYAAATSLTPRIEADLASRVAARLNVDAATIAVSGRDVTVAGVSPEALAALRDEPGLRKIAVAAPPVAPPSGALTAQPQPSQPYVFAVTLRENMIALDGKLPDAALRQQAVARAAAAGAGLAVTDSATIDPHAPAGDYATALGAALDALGALAQGKVTLSDTRLSIEGKGRANVRAESLGANVKAHLPPGFDLAKVDVTPGPVSPYLFEATRKDGVVTLSGFAPDDSVHARLVEFVRRRFFDATLTDRLDVAAGAPPKFVEAAEAGLAALARLEDGRLALSDADLALTGVARFDSARAEINAALDAGAPKNFKSDPRLMTHTLGAPLDAAGCRAAFARLSTTPVLFDADDAAISDESAALVDGLTATALRCQGAPIEVAGHLDDQGIAELARDRSKRRAQLVVDKFVKAGADSFHVWAMGYGGERPLAPNDSAENRARNRRIEFIVK
ncbi:OmpA family protein [Methylocystis echinoides]|uniref:Membrane protein n=1 Tax=Methylocystis echinoides TaxID=29468 RepID=A0A9W6LRK5_9HYPH|nr:OmpA family protein [Methylocystis echinoides]GLI92557.1 membrane protein [Methylocystis echinoides]